MYCYWYVMNDYGIPIKTTLYILNKEGYMPLAEDVYNPTIPSRGNSNYQNDAFKGTLNWDKQYRNSVDLRLFYTHLEAKDWS